MSQFMNLAALMIKAGRRPSGAAGVVRETRRYLDYLAGRSGRSRQRYVLSLVYPFMFFYTIPAACAGALVSVILERLGVALDWTTSIGLAITFVPASVMMAIYVHTFRERLSGRDPAAMVLGKNQYPLLMRLSLVGYGTALVLGIVAARTWAA